MNLDGEWEFYEGELLSPEDFRQGRHAPPAYLSVPDTWNGKNLDGGMSRKGSGTYRLQVMLKNTDDILGLKIGSIRMSHRLFIDGREEGGSGLPSLDKGNFQPGNTPYSVFFHPDTRKLEIVIQVSNYNFVTGGIVNSITFGAQEDITRRSTVQFGADIGIILILGMFGAYHLSFYYIGRREKEYLLSGLFLLLLALQNSLYGEKVFQRLLPDIPFDIAYKLLDVSQFLGGALIIVFFCTVESHLMSLRRLKLLLSPFIVYLAAVLLLPYEVHIRVKYYFILYLWLVVLGIIARMVYLYIRRQSQVADRAELMLFIGGATALMIYLMNDSLYSENIVQSNFTGRCGVIAFIILINILLAVRFSNAYDKTEILSRKLWTANQLKDEFLMNTSHEIKTPLHGIMNMTSFLLEDGDGNLHAGQKQNLWLIKDTSTKLSMLIQDLIDVSLLKHGELRLQQTVVDLRVAVQIVFDILQFELTGKEVALLNQVEAGIWVLADESRLRQVMYNLVHNAIKHTEYGSIQITASVAGNEVSIKVKDTGTGISEDNHSAIFEYFEQADKLLPQDGYTGMGVGLYISRKLVERMGGRICVDWSEKGKGTRMLFTLPKVDRIPEYQQDSATGTYRTHAHVDYTVLDILDRDGQTILIVDDEASNIHTLLHILRRHDYNVITAFSAKEALSKMQEFPGIDLVILDIMMPGTSGIELCRTLRSRYSILDLPILFATVKDAPPDIALGFRAGANDYVTKPFEGETLLARIHTLLAMKTSIQEAIRHEQAFHQAQIKPHFLYNAMSSIISFCYTDGEKAAYLLTMLSQYIRFILDMDRSTLVIPLHRELELIQAYVEIEQARFGERFDYTCQVDKLLDAALIPSLCIQPFIENAIRHGLFEKEGQGNVSLKIQGGDGYMKITIEDNGVGIPDGLLYKLTGQGELEGSIGIRNVRKRLDSIPGASLTIHSEEAGGTKVTIYLPVSRDICF
ncbi:ATP-binding protein [Paenibacillus sp. MMS20-IR301]|uniref:hybrid sensor histidine kinase/response regulator n=1 Tax=Paenibacillus sp. MMS20-IR301 TaxID=2895946 RepID=UPI0028F11E6B|nr:ATP-binding protein [Paenibacillus sp. MMS20-IR301]WNS46425.1 ATP-binding protein [Paenibacillus sp. MMS20-IR301]